MKIGIVFPHTEIGSDPSAVRDYVQAVEAIGYSHMMAYDHVLGADTSHHANWEGSYTAESMFHEPFVLFGYLAGVTTTLELVTAVLILSQRQTAPVAKPARPEGRSCPSCAWRSPYRWLSSCAWRRPPSEPARGPGASPSAARPRRRSC